MRRFTGSRAAPASRLAEREQEPGGPQGTASQNLGPDDGSESRSLPALIRERLASSWLLGVLVLLFLVFSIANHGAFVTSYNIESILTAAAAYVIIAVGETYVIATAGVDLSVGGVLVFSGIVAAKFMQAHGATYAGWGIVAAGAVIALACGAAWGLINGLLVARLRIPPLIATLGTLGASTGLAQVLTSGLDIRTIPNNLVNTIGFGKVLSVRTIVIIAAAVALIGGYILFRTRFGLRTLAIGSNVEGARRVGIDPRRHLTRVYMLQGVLVGLASVISLAQYSSTTINGHSTDSLTVIAGVVLGGTSLFGGVASMMGTVIGVLVPVTLLDGLVIIGVEPFWQSVVVGAVLVVAVYIDQLKRRPGSRKLGG
jgi:ribose transport system permease protein